MLKTTIQEMNRLTPEAFHDAKKVPLIVVLDNVRSQHNIGAVFRTADAFCLQGVWLCGICCCPPNNEIHKTALGAELTVDWRYFEQTIDAVKALQVDGYTVYAIEQAHGSTYSAICNYLRGKRLPSSWATKCLVYNKRL